MDNALLLSTVGGLLASLVTKTISHKVKDLHPVTEVTLFGVVAFAGVALQWFLSGGANHLVGYDILAAHWAEVSAAGTFLYQYIVKPLYGVLYAEKKADEAAAQPDVVTAPQEYEETPVADASTWTNTPAPIAVVSASDALPGEADF